MIELAVRLGVNTRTVAALETGSPSVSIGTVFIAALLVGVELFGLSDPERARARRAATRRWHRCPNEFANPHERRARMTSPSEIFAWDWLPEGTSPVVVGRIRASVHTR